MSKKKFVPVIIILTLCLALTGVLAACDKTEKEGVFAQAGIPVQDEYGFWGYVNSAGEEVIAFDYVTATPFDNGVAVVAAALSNGTDPGVYYLIDSEGSHIAGPYAYAQLIEGGKYAIVAKKASSAFSKGDVLYGVYDIAASAMAKDFTYSSISWDKETGVVFAQLNNFTYVWKAEDLSDVGVRIGTAASGGGSQGYAYIWTETAEDGSVVFRCDVPVTADLAPNLKGRLLLITGDVDNNVHPASTLRLARALIRAGKYFDMMILPGEDHELGDKYYVNLIRLYFAEHLLGMNADDINDY